MNNKNQNYLKKIKAGFAFLNVIFWQKIYLAIVVFVLLGIVAAVGIFYVYYFPKPLKSTMVSQIFEVKQELLDSFINEVTTREKNFQDASTKFYPELFRGPR